MPRQLHSPISQGGSNVSGGQRQRLAIARHPPPRHLPVRRFVLLALDLATDARLRAALVPVDDAVTVIVAQRVDDRTPTRSS
jgi:ATP-binding cassette subfamily B protein